MIDIHTHIIPQVDDGSSSLEMSFKMIEEQIKIGVKKVVLTPHMTFIEGRDNKRDFIINAFNEFKDKVKHYDIKLYLGSEIYYTKDLNLALEQNKVISINNSKYFLIEFNLIQNQVNIKETLYNLKVKGYFPILAHPERYEELDIDDISFLKNKGIIIQINTSSIYGLFGKRAQKFSLKLLKLGLVDFIASDCHSMNDRLPNLTTTIEFLKKKHKIDFTNSSILNDILT